MTELQAVILAAGRARRMRPLSDDTHKALLTVGETTILERIVEGLHGIGVRRITVVTGYRAGEVRAYLLDRFPDGGLRFLENAEYATTNNVVSLSLALEAIDIADGDLVLAECDLLVEPEVFSLLLRPGNVALVDTFRTGMDGTVVSVSDGVVSAVHAPHVQGPGFVYADKRKTLNLYRFERGFVEGALRPMVRWYAESVDAGSYYELVLAKLVDLPRQRIAAVEVPPGSWIEVDDPNDLAAARFLFEPDRRSEILDGVLGGHWSFDILDFSFMANRYFPTDGMLAAMGHALPELVSSYGSRQAVVDQKLAWAIGCRPDRVRALAGASQAFPWLAEILPAGRVAVPAPTFGEYRRAFPDADLYHDLPGIDLGALDLLAANNDTIVVVNPNNPTATTLDTADLHALAARHPGTRFLVDESFVAFSGQPSLTARLEHDPLANVVVIESLSKVLGVPGLRLGFLYTADPEVRARIDAHLPVWGIGAMSEFLLELLLKFRPQLEASIARTIQDREELRAGLRAIDGVQTVHESGANFVLLTLGGAAALGARLRAVLLAREAIEIKDVSARFADGRARVRVAVRTPPDNARLVEALTRTVPELWG
jgi:histidinol-phosphate/aromatic aminotransferase/cobyric acid decarboxylase-like protein